jgi:hypothetical protein
VICIGVAVALAVLTGCTAAVPGGGAPQIGDDHVPDRAPVEISPALAGVLDRFERFLVSDDVERSDAIAGSDDQSLRDLVDAVTPLFDEINAVLDVLVAHPHPLPADQEALETHLNDLGQAGVEAQLELESRGT